MARNNCNDVMLPAAKEINVYDSLDERSACRNFLGKNLDEAEGLFRENALNYQEDLMFMGPIGFRFYAAAFIRYLQNDQSKGDSDAASTFASVLEYRTQQEPAEVKPISRELAAACSYMAEHYEKFDLTPEIYGDVCGRLQALQQILSVK